MTYAVETKDVDGVVVYELRQSNGVVARIAPALGNNCFSFEAGGERLDLPPFDEFLKKPTSHGMPILFPFPNRLRDGKFTFAGKTYHVDPPRHGFVRDKAWMVRELDACTKLGAFLKASLDTADHPSILSQFPFPFRIEVTYCLERGVLSMHVHVFNTGSEPMPCGFGIHPYFARPPRARLQVPARKRFELDDALPTGRLEDLAGAYDFQIAAEVGCSLDDIYTDLKADAFGLVSCLLSSAEADDALVVEFKARDFPHIVLFTPPSPRQAVCIEPYTCPTDAFNLGRDVMVLHPKKNWTLDVRLYARQGGTILGA